MDYREFLARKRVRALPSGIAPPELHPTLFPFQRDITRQSLERGRSAVFAGCGLGKSRMALSWAHAVAEHTGKPVLILTPLAVAAQFVREGAELDMTVYHSRGQEPGLEARRIYVTNYENLHRWAPYASALGAVVLDESSILKAFDGKTRTRLIETFAPVPMKLCCTATPAPNDHVELGNHAEFLGIMKREEMLANWFCHEGGDTSVWRLKGHAVKDFWRWVCSWAVCLQQPSDLGYTNDGYDLPPLVYHEHIVDVDQSMAHNAGMLFAYEAATLSEQRAVRKSTLDERVRRVAALVNDSTEQWTVWCELNDEGEALAKAINGAVEVTGSDTAERKEQALMAFIDGTHRVLVSKSSICGFGVNMQNCANTVFVGASHSFESVYQTVRRHYRFGQKRQVNAHFVSTSADGRVVHNLKRKQDDAERMQREMVEAMNDN